MEEIKKCGRNLYYNSNIGVEAYLLEIGYINSKNDLENILNNRKGYVEGIVKTIKDELLGENYESSIQQDKKQNDINNVTYFKRQ